MIKDIESEKRKLVTWHEALPQYNLAVHNNYDPLYQEFCEVRKKIVFFFNSVFDNKLFKKTDKAKLRHIITDISTQLIDNGMTELIPIYDKYAETSFEEADQEADKFAGETLKP